MDIVKSKNNNLYEEISDLRNPQGYSGFIHAVKQFNESAAELENLNKEKWDGLLAMDSCLEGFYDKAGQQLAKKTSNRLKQKRRSNRNIVEENEAAAVALVYEPPANKTEK